MRWWWLVFAVGCAPTHVPRAGTLSLLEEQGDVQLAGQMGTHGLSGEVSYAVSDAVAVRGGAQTAPTPKYGSGWLGVGPYYAFGNGRFGAFVEGGGGIADSVSDVTVTTSSGTSTSRYRNQGGFVHGGLSTELGVEFPFFAAGLNVRGVYQQFVHGPASDSTGTANLMSLESHLVVRAGAPSIKFEYQLGMAWPFFLGGEQGVYFPLRSSIGLVWDFPEKTRSRPGDPVLPPRPMTPPPAPAPPPPPPAEPVPSEGPPPPPAPVPQGAPVRPDEPPTE